MAGKTLIGGTAYTISGGKARVDGVSYSISGGKTCVGGTTYDISFQKTLSIVDLFESIDTSTIGVGGANDDTSTSAIEVTYTASGTANVAFYAFVFCEGNLVISKIKGTGSGTPSVSVLNQGISQSAGNFYASAVASYTAIGWTQYLIIKAQRPVIGDNLPQRYGTIFVCRFNDYSEEEVDSVLSNMTITSKAFVGEHSSTRPATVQVQPAASLLSSMNIIAIGDKFAFNGIGSMADANTIYSNNTSNPCLYIKQTPVQPASASLNGSAVASVYNGNWFFISE